MKITQDNIHEILALLGEHLAETLSSPTRLIVCGGTALNVLNLVSRTTKDVDVIGVLTHLTNGLQNCPKSCGDVLDRLELSINSPMNGSTWGLNPI